MKIVSIALKFNKLINVSLICLTTLIFDFSCTEYAKPPKYYQWSNSHHGGGGYVTGIIQHPVNPDIVFFRTDVGGVFRSDNGGKSWKAMNNGINECYGQNVETFAISQLKPDIMFRGCGEARNHKMEGAIHKSKDGGKTWYRVTDKPDFFGNGDTRFYGEKLATDPFDPNFVVAASNTKGIWTSNDEGENWQCAGLEKEPFGCLAFHPYVKDRLYAATLDSLPFSDYIFPDASYKREKIGRLYLSTDKGKNWKIIFEKKGASFTNLVFDNDKQDNILATFRNDGIYKSTDGGKTFIKKTINQGKVDFSTISSDLKSTVYYAAVCRIPGQKNIPIFPLYKSEDKGDTWALIKNNYVWNDFKNYPLQYDRPEVIGWALSKFLVDNKNPEKFYLSGWFGLSVSEDACQTWNGNQYKGIENTCLEMIVSDPKGIGKVFLAGADGQPRISTDSGKTYRSFPYLEHPNVYYSSTVVCSSKFQHGLVLYSSKSNQNSVICKSEDDGLNGEFIMHFPKGLYVQAIKEDPYHKGRFYAYVDGPIAHGAGLYQSINWGGAWLKLDYKLPEKIKTLPHRSDFIEGELLPVTAYQNKNACGTNQLLCIDPTRENIIYFGEPTEGIFVKFEDFKEWTNIGKGLPFGKDTSSVLNVIKADPMRKGWLYAGFIHEGLWRSKNFGNTWEKIFPKDSSVFNATSLAIGGPSGNELYVACEPMFWSKAESAIFTSFDLGETWTNIYDKSLGAIRWKGIDIDNKTGILYGVSCGNGAFYALPVR